MDILNIKPKFVKTIYNYFVFYVFLFCKITNKSKATINL